MSDPFRMSSEIYVTAEMLRDAAPMQAVLNEAPFKHSAIDVSGLDEHDARMLRSAHSLRDDCDARGYDEIAEFVIDAIEARRVKQ